MSSFLTIIFIFIMSMKSSIERCVNIYVGCQQCLEDDSSENSVCVYVCVYIHSVVHSDSLKYVAHGGGSSECERASAAPPF